MKKQNPPPNDAEYALQHGLRALLWMILTILSAWGANELYNYDPTHKLFAYIAIILMIEALVFFIASAVAFAYYFRFRSRNDN